MQSEAGGKAVILKKGVVMRNVLILIGIIFLNGCAAVGPSVIQTYSNESERNQIAILKAQQTREMTIQAADDLLIPASARYVLLQPGRHKINFMTQPQSLMVSYRITNKVYLDAVAGHTYILKSKGAGVFLLGDKWFPEVVDVTDDLSQHVSTIPKEIETK
ncbi:MAG: hypothetical protein HQL20_09670 [Candidatus Omnitrophica bacterium]|nr:hypothetical protein [Candidatus Omnitrophota bacterium]